MDVESDLNLIKRYQKEIKLFSSTLALLNWDQETHMPKGGIETRAESMAFLAGLAHEKRISDEFFYSVNRLVGKTKGDDAIMVERLHHDLEKSRKLPKEFVEELTKVTAIASEAWKSAREKNDFQVFKPHLERIVELKREEARLIGLPGHLYNSLLDDYEEGMTVEKLSPKFEQLKKGIIGILKKLESSEVYKNQKVILAKGNFPKDFQMQLAKDVVKRIGLGESNSRLDFSEHPFTTTIGLNDVRITTNVRDDPLFSFGSSIHEAGHSLYELGMPKEHFFDALYGEPSMGIHESQSRFWENMVGLSKPFWKFYFPKFDKLFKLGGNFDQWYHEVNLVVPGKVRIEADEVHYGLHVVLRYELEKGLIDGSISVADLPKLWNQKMKDYFCVEVTNDKEGVLQDVHWSNGYFGYFPTYVLGSIYAVQLFDQMRNEIKGIESRLEKGDFGEMGMWLKDRVHRHGRKMLAEDLIKSVCGEGLNVDSYIDYLDKKYSELYSY
jgi:carboxypeptidase Taq